MKTNKNKNILSQLFFNELEKLGAEGRIYTHLFSFLSPESLEEQLIYLFNLKEGKNSYFKEDGKENWFAIFHKSIRQCDFFSDVCYKKSKCELITEEEEKEFKFLLNKVKKDGYNKKGENGKLFTDEYNRYLDLNQLRKRQTIDQSINGELDSILWNFIDMEEGKLTKAFDRTFADYQFELAESVKQN